MFTILLHSSKTMRSASSDVSTESPQFLAQARELADYVSSLSGPQVAKAMGVSEKLAESTLSLMKDWSSDGSSIAVDSFIGDIYSGLQAASLSKDEREYANDNLLILSGLYGALRPLNSIAPYRLEMGYRFPDPPFDNLYKFWGDRIAKSLPGDRTIINTSSVEYTKAIFPYIKGARIITPKFLTISPKTGDPTFVTVHAKIARGAFARWMITERIEDEAEFVSFAEIGYEFHPELSTEMEPVYIAREFKGLGLSVRLEK